MSDVISKAAELILRFIGAVYTFDDVSLLQDAVFSITGFISKSEQQLTLGCEFSETKYHELQTALATINEKENIRKSKGVYYTPVDVVWFITVNSIRAAFGVLQPESFVSNDLSNIPYEEFCMNKSVLEPTCGAGEFLLTALELKLDAWKNAKRVFSIEDVTRIIKTLHGNDINDESTTITKLRLFLLVLKKCGVEIASGVATALESIFTNCDFVELPDSFISRHDIILGNPPYVEDNKYGDLTEHFGNVYGNVLKNASQRLTESGVMGFIIPLSYISTPRMKRIREQLFSVLPVQYIMSFADRPDCLFSGVHQKLCILIACPGKTRSVFTSHYCYWYKEERNRLFSHKLSVALNPYESDDFIPKLGNAIELSIYRKIIEGDNRESVYATSRSGSESVYLNRRETFWIKAFREPHIHPEYKVFSYHDSGEADYCYCLVNSSLFWWYWISVSDCWHVSRELNGFMAPTISAFDMATHLATQLRTKLEETKVFVGTKQTDYEYKHSACINEIHAIDDYINALFGLTELEGNYIKEFAYIYRMSEGITNNECD